MLVCIISKICLSVKSCGHPGSPLHGKLIGHYFTYGQTVTFECDNGFNLTGDSSLYCNASGEWEGMRPSCQGTNITPSMSHCSYLCIFYVYDSRNSVPTEARHRFPPPNAEQSSILSPRREHASDLLFRICPEWIQFTSV